ncbi:hypothetical protein [Leuconostoc mesenteroides]|jgi:hypothetical protein
MQPKQEDIINDLLQQVANLTFVNSQLKSVVNQYQSQEQEEAESVKEESK